MDIKTVIEARRSVKHYDRNHVMADDEIQELLSLAILSPTAFNIQNWRFVVVTDSELRKKIRAVSYDQSQITDSSILIILCADVKAWEKQPERYWVSAPQEIQEYLMPLIDNFYRGREQVQRDEAMRSCGIAVQTLMLAAKDMGYDTCPMIGFDSEKVAELINLPSDHVISLFLSVGKGIKEPWPRGGQLKLDEVLIKDTF